MSMQKQISDGRPLTGFILLVGLAVVPCRLVAQQNQRMTQQWSVEGENFELLQPKSIVVTSDCSVWVSDPRSGLWRWQCDADTPTRVSRGGEGPGEYESSDLVVKAAGGRQVMLWDRTLHRVTSFKLDGAYIDEQSMRIPESSFGRVMGMSSGLAGGGLLMWTSAMPYIMTPGVSRAYVLSVDSAGVIQDSLQKLDGFGSVFWEDDGLASRFNSPFQRRPFVLFLANGGWLAANNDSAIVTRFNGRGERIGSVTLDLPEPGEVSDAGRRAYIDSVKASVEREMEQLRYAPPLREKFRKTIERNLRSHVEFPNTHQWYDQLVLDEKERALWVELPAFGASYSRTWLVMDLNDGRVRRRVTVPHRGSVVDAALYGDCLYAIEMSPDDIPRVARYGPSVSGK